MAARLAPPPPVPVFDSEAHALAGLRAFFQLMERWGVGNEEARVLLGRPSPRTLYNWKAGRAGRLPHDTMRRISYLLGIHKALRILFGEPANTYGWLRRPNADFGGQAPLARMLAGDVTDLAAVRRYLDAARGAGAVGPPGG